MHTQEETRYHCAKAKAEEAYAPGRLKEEDIQNQQHREQLVEDFPYRVETHNICPEKDFNIGCHSDSQLTVRSFVG